MKFIFFIFFFCFTSVLAQESKDSITQQLFEKVVYTLANDSLKGRATGSTEEYKSLAFIDEQFQLLAHKHLSKHAFLINVADSTQLTAVNGYYFLNNRAKNTVILSAHYDHIGLGGPLSMSKKTDVVHNGADDNASGVALLLGLSDFLIHQKKANVNYLIVFYSGHEIGLFGSEAFAGFVEQKKRKFKSVSSVVNFDMVGRLSPDLKKLKCMCSPTTDSILKTVNPSPFGFTLNITDEAKLNQLDTKVFYNKHIPCVSFTTGMHNDYHATSDDPQYINYKGMVAIYNYLCQLILKLGASPN
ncbi:MAG: M28 family peptidase [Fluviicola sp.]|nr:M28 family peptidase [Fluviicola sp.]